jgi:hypothetical protein
MVKKEKGKEQEVKPRSNTVKCEEQRAKLENAAAQ